jgi:hypothetical protein
MPNAETDCIDSINRYIVKPSQATAYKIGMLKILELREKAKKQLSAKFDLRQFHEVVLTNGTLPLDVLEELVDKWVKSRVDRECGKFRDTGVFGLAFGRRVRIISQMKKMLSSLVMSLLLVAAMAYGGIPPMNVTVSDASGKAAFKGATNTSGAFATAKLQPGNYVVQLNSKNAPAKGTYYAIVVSAGKKKVSADAVPAEKFAGGGVALKVDVGPGLNIIGQVATEAKVKNNKKMVWIPPAIGSNMPGKWVEEGSAEAIAARNSGQLRTEDVRKWQDHGDIVAPGR